MIDRVDLLETEDIFDLYGCEYLLNASHFHVRQLEPDDRQIVIFRVNEIHDKYVASVRERVKAELVFCGVKFDSGFSMRSMVKAADDLLAKEIEKQSNKMMFNGGFNLLGTMITAHQQAGGDMKGIDQKRLNSILGSTPVASVKKDDVRDNAGEGFFNNPKWKIIADAFVALEEANTIDAKIQSIDRLNDLQHNSFHLLIDLQTGRMLEQQSEGGGKGKHEQAVDVLKEVFDIKQGAISPKEFADRMTGDIRRMIRRCAK